MLQILRMSANDFDLYRNACMAVDFNQHPDSEIVTAEDLVDTSLPIPSWEDFINLINSDDVEIYFLMEDDKPQGLAEIIFEKKQCYISLLAVFKQGQGFGTFFYNELEKVIRNYGFIRTYLFCPFYRAGKFWIKQGFSKEFNDWTYAKWLF